MGSNWRVLLQHRFVIVSSVPLLFRSRPQEKLMTARESSNIRFNCPSIVFTYFIISFYIPYNVFKWREDDPACEVDVGFGGELVDIHLKSWKLIKLKPAVSVWPLTSFSVSPKSCPAVFQRWFFTCLKFASKSFPRWTAARRVVFMSIHLIAKFTLKYSTGSPRCFLKIFLTMEKTASM